MSTKVITDPSALGWEQDGATANGTPIYKWAEGADNEHPIVDGDTEGQVTTWDGAKWTPDSTVVVNGGNVGIGTADPKYSLSVSDAISLYEGSDGAGTVAAEAGKTLRLQARSGQDIIMKSGGGTGSSLTIDAAGNATFSGTVNALRLAMSDAGLLSGLGSDGSGNYIMPGTGVTGDPVDGTVSLGRPASAGAGTNYRFKDATFSGTVNAGSAKIGTVSATGANGAGFINTATDTGVVLTNNGAALAPTEDGTRSLGSVSLKFNAGFFSGTVNANKFVGDGSGLTGVGGGLPPGDFTHNGKITATDFIATSDERAKDNITTASVGLIDSLKGREWDWKESGEKGSGVVAQELEEVLPHLVHTDDEGMKSVAYNGLVAYLIEEVKALKAEIKEMKS